jgi:hypothetical protein
MVGKAYQFVCFYALSLLDPLTAWEPSEYFLEKKGYVVGTLRMLNWDIKKDSWLKY